MMSVCIPVYEMDTEGERFLRRALQSVEAQYFTDYETIVSDHSVGSELERVCGHFPNIRYLRNPKKRGNSSANLNNALDHAKGDYIKIIFQDDFLAVPWALGSMMDQLGDRAWLVHAYWHTDISGDAQFQPTRPFIPDEHERLLRSNSVGAPSALMFKKNDLRFDENLIWLMDCDFYFRCLQTYGLPAIVWEPLAVQTLWPGQLTNKISDAVKTSEAHYVRTKYALSPAFVTPDGAWPQPSPKGNQAPSDRAAPPD